MNRSEGPATRNSLSRWKALAFVVLPLAACTITKTEDQGTGGTNAGQSGGGRVGAVSTGGSTSAGDSGASDLAGGVAGKAGTPADMGGAPPDEAGAGGAAGSGGAAGAGGEGPSDLSWRVPQSGTAVPSGSGAPSITGVYASRIGQNLRLEVEGTGFGSAPGTLPAVESLTVFGLYDTTQGGWCAGKGNCPVDLQYTSWKDTAIVIDGFGSGYGGRYKMLPGDLVSIIVQSTAEANGPTVTWTGTLEPRQAPPLNPGGPNPQVASVEFCPIGRNMHIDVVGAGFGTAPGTLPAVESLTVFGLYDTTQGGWCAGRGNCPVDLQYTSWTDTAIAIDGFGSSYGGQFKVAAGDAVSIFVQNAQGPEFTVWTGTLKPGRCPGPDPDGPTPRVESVVFSQVGQNLHIVVDGSGFGNAPGTLPAVESLTVFGLYDTTKGGWCAGRGNCPVDLQYTSWTDAKIVVSGFGSAYGTQYNVASGDAVSIYLQNTGGPEFTVWTGNLP